MTRPQALVVGLVAAGGVAFFFLRPEVPEVDPQRAAPLIEAKRDRAASEDPASDRYAGRPALVLPAPIEREGTERPDGAAAPSAAEQAKEVHQRFEARFAHAGADPQWAAQAKAIADQKLPSLLPQGSTVRSFECRVSMCRLETAHKGHDDYMKFIDAAFLRPEGHLWNAPTYSTPLTGNPADGLMVTYIAREGRTLSD